VAGHRLHRLHVDGVDVRALLAVDLHVHEVLVHVRRGLVVLERLVRHDVAPVAGGVADRQQHRHPAPLGLLEGLRAPLPPVDRVVLVLEQVRAGGGRKAVGHVEHLPSSAPVDPQCRAARRHRAGRQLSGIFDTIAMWSSIHAAASGQLAGGPLGAEGR
jgi:hypothetical protein